MGNRNSHALVARSLGLVLLISLIGPLSPVASADVLPSIADNQFKSLAPFIESESSLDVNLAPISYANSPAFLPAIDDWTQKTPSPKPSARADHAMANISGDQVLLFGGWDGVFDDETWVYDLSDNTWTQKYPTTKPSARLAHSMANIDGDQVLLFGGYDDDEEDDETWVYDLSTNTWTQKAPVDGVKPSVRAYHAMANIGGDQVLLFGGGYEAYDFYDETWVYDLSINTWTQMDSEGDTKPSARYFHAMANIGNDQVLLFGGLTTGLIISSETWVYDLSINTWTQMAPVGDKKPSVRMSHAMANIDGDQVLLFGGEDVIENDESWVYDLSDNSWTQKSPATKPSARRHFAMADIGGGQVLLFGGWDGAADDETWVYLSAHEIFSDGFESGDLTAWDSSKTSSSDLKACAKAPITGTYSLCVKNKTNKTKFVKDDGFTESAYSFQFNLDPNGIKVKNKKKIRLVQAQGSKNTTWIEFRRKTGAYQLRAWAGLDGGAKTKTGWKTISNAPHLIEVDWSASTGADDGFLRLYIDVVLKQELSGLDNDTYNVQKIMLGITKTVPIFREMFYLDDFKSTNGGHIGP